MTLEEMKLRRALVRAELDRNLWRYQRLGERLDRLAKEMEDLTVEIDVASIQRDYQPPAEPVRPTKMEIVGP